MSPFIQPSRKTAFKKSLLFKLTFVAIFLFILFYAVCLSRTRAPDVTWTTLHGDKTALNALRGQMVIVNFWATSCATCVTEMPKLIDTWHRYKDQGLVMVAIAMHYDRPDYVLKFTQSRQLPFDVALDIHGDLARAFGNVKMTPTTFLINKKGHIIRHYLGEPSFLELHQLLDKEITHS